ncbi:MAG: APC family permease [Sulfurospirillaceae bacterium]|nr:APC family permease [Sulfurospirillaceae bacterium]
MNTKDKDIGLFGAIAIGVGGMVGGGIFAVLGEAVSLAKGATAISFFVAGIVALLTSYSYAKLSVRYQNRGGTVVFIDNAFKHNLLSGSINLLLWLSYLVTISLYATAFASYGLTFFKNTNEIWLRHALISFAIILPAAINLLKASFVSKSESFIVAIKIILLMVIIVFGSSHVDMSRLSPSNWEPAFSIIVAGMIIFVAYEGFELIANTAEEIKDPEKNLPRAFYGSVIFVIVLYMLIALITVGSVSQSKLIIAKDYALAIAAQPTLGHVGFVIVSVAALLATFSAINATIYGNARLGYIIAKEGKLPKILDKEKRDIPVFGVIITSIISLLIANSINLTEIAIIGSAGFLLIFSIVNISAYRLVSDIKADKKVLLFSSIISTVSLFTLLIYTYAKDSNAVFVFLIFVIFSFLFEFCYGRFVRGHFFNRKY